MMPMPVVPDARHRAPPQRRPWSWTDALPAVAPGRRYLVSWLLVSAVRERCREVGFDEGDEVTCEENRHGPVVLRLADGRVAHLEREIAWFVQVMPADRPW